MAEGEGEAATPTRTRRIVAAIIVALVVLAVWAVIEYRQNPPPPGQKSEARVSKSETNPKD